MKAVTQSQLGLHGKVEIFVTKGKPVLSPGKLLFSSGGRKVYDSCQVLLDESKILSQDTLYNIIVNNGKDKVITALVQGYVNMIGRMAIGDRGALPSDPTIPKVPVATQTALFNEVYRDDIEATVVNVGTPTVHSVQFIKTFSAVDIPLASFSNQAKPVVNEVCLVTYDQTILPLPRAPVAAPTIPPADELMFSIRTFKSVPFEAANEIAVTIKYSIFIE